MPLLGMLTAEHSGFANPSAACTASNIGSTYYLGNKGGQDMIAQCVGGQGLTSYPTMTASTLNKPGTTTTTTTSSPSGTANCSYTRGTFMNGEQTIEWVNGGATCTTPPADATGWVLQSVGIWHRVVSSSSTTTTTTTTAEACSYTTGSFTSGINTVDWACGSASCTGAPSGTGWVDQGNGCYQRLVPSGAGSADTSAAGAGTGGGSGGAAAGGSGGGIGGNNGDDGGAVGGGVSI